MNKKIRIGLISLAVFLLMTEDMFAPGGGRGGGGGGRGGGGARGGGGGHSYSRGSSYHGGRSSSSINRSPSLSRPQSSYSRRTTSGAYSRSGSSGRDNSSSVRNYMDMKGSSSGTGRRYGDGSSSSDSPGTVTGRRFGDGDSGQDAPGTVTGRRYGDKDGSSASHFLQNKDNGYRQMTGRRSDYDKSQYGRDKYSGRDYRKDNNSDRRDNYGSRGNDKRWDNRTDGRDRWSYDRPNRIENRDNWYRYRDERRNEVWNQVRDNYRNLDYWSHCPWWDRWRINNPYYWCTWPAFCGWCGGGDPVYYNYGDNIYYQDGSVYEGENDQNPVPEDEYVSQAEQIAGSAPQIDPSKADWKPLGVFALTKDGKATGPDPTLFLQLSISREGVVSGTFHNATTNTTKEVTGMLDKKTQRVVWKDVGQPRPLMECGAANLTQDTVPILIHFADGQTQQWLMVRLQDPGGSDNGGK